MSLRDDLDRTARLAVPFAEPGETLAGVIATEAEAGRRVYLCAFERDGDSAWLALDDRGIGLTSRADVRAAASVAALCEIAEDSAGEGDLDDLRSRLVGLRLTEDPPGIEAADKAVQELQRVLAAPPQVATPERLDAIGAAARRLERALGEDGASPFTEAMKASSTAVQAFTSDVETNYKGELG